MMRSYQSLLALVVAGFAEAGSVAADVNTDGEASTKIPLAYTRWGMERRGDVAVTLGKEHPLLSGSPGLILWYEGLQIPGLTSADSFVELDRNLFVMCVKKDGKNALFQVHWIDKDNRTVRSSEPAAIDFAYKINWSGKDSPWVFSHIGQSFEVACPELSFRHVFDFSQSCAKSFGCYLKESGLAEADARLSHDETCLGRMRDGDIVLSLVSRGGPDAEDLMFSLGFRGKTIEDVVDGTSGYKDLGAHIFVLTNVRDDKGCPILWKSDPISVARRRVRACLLNKETLEVLTAGPLDSEYHSIKKSAGGGVEDRFLLKDHSVRIVTGLSGKEYRFDFGVDQ